MRGPRAVLHEHPPLTGDRPEAEDDDRFDRRRMRRSGRSRAVAGARPAARVERAVAIALLGVEIVVAPQLLGGAFAWGVAITGALAGVALLAALFASRGTVLPRVSALGIVLLVAVGWTAIQALPLPCGVAG